MQRVSWRTNRRLAPFRGQERDLGTGKGFDVNESNGMGIIIEDDGPALIIIFLFICIVSIAFQIMENARQRRKLAVVAGPNQEMRANRRMFFYTVLVIGLLTLVANYIMGITSSLAASHLGELEDSAGLLSLPGTGTTLVTTGLYALAILVTAALMQKKERLAFPELLADLNDARKFGALDSARQVAHYRAELDQLRAERDSERAGPFSGEEFERFFTSHESPGRPGLVEQLKYLKTEQHHRARTRNFQRNILLNYRITTGKWILPFALLAGLSLFFTVRESLAANDGDGDFSLAIVWAVASVLGLAATAGQYFSDVGKVLLVARRNYISHQTQAECLKILADAEAELAAVDAAEHVGGAVCGCIHDDGWEPILSIGRWALRRRTRRR